MVCSGGGSNGGGNNGGGNPTPVPSCQTDGEIVDVVDGYYSTGGVCYAASFGVDSCGVVHDMGILDDASPEDCAQSQQPPSRPPIYPCLTNFSISPSGATCETPFSWDIKAQVGFPKISLDARPYPATLVRWNTALRLGDMPPKSGSGHLGYAPLGGGSDANPAAGDWRDITLTLKLTPLQGFVKVNLPNVGDLTLPLVGPTGNPTIFHWQVPSHPAAGGGPLAGQVGQLQELPSDMPLFTITGTKAPYQLSWSLTYYQWESSCVGGSDIGGGTNCRKDPATGLFTGHREWGWKHHSDGGIIPPSAVQGLPAGIGADLNGDGVPDAYWDKLVQIRRMDDNNRIDNPQWAHTYFWGGPTWWWGVREGQGQVGWPGEDPQ